MRVSQAQLLRNTLFRYYETLSSEYREKNDFDSFYKKKMNQFIDHVKSKI